MTKHTDDLHESIEPRLRRVPGSVDDAGHAVIRRSVILYLASIGDLTCESADSVGSALAVICGEWMQAKMTELRKQNGPPAD